MPRSGSLLDDLTTTMDGGRPGAALPAMAAVGVGGLAGLPMTGNAQADPNWDDPIQRAINNIPDFTSMRRMQQSLLARHEARQREQAQRQAELERLQREAEEESDDDDEGEEADGAAALTSNMQRMREVLGLGDLEEAREAEQVLVPMPPPEGEADTDLEGGYGEALAAAAAQLGLGADLAELFIQEEPDEVLQDAFRSGLRSGFVRTTALARGSAGQPLVQALLTTMARSPDAETAGAAFVTLMALMGDRGAATTAGSGSGSDDAEAQAGQQEGGAPLMLDAHYGLPAASPQQPPCALDAIPTDSQLMEALRHNGFNPGAASGASGRQQQTAAAGAGLGQAQEGGGEGQEGSVVRLQAIKLILRTAAAVCRYCRKHPVAPASRGALSREGVAELLLAALHMGLDPAANQLQEDLDAAVLELLPAMDEADWQRKLPQLADRILDMGPSHLARHKLLKKVPTTHPRGLALQQFTAAVLLERLIPAPAGGSSGGGGGRSAINRREPSSLDPTAVITAQPWFSNPKALINGATSGGGQVPRGGYKIGMVELLLKVCHLLLWPHALKLAADEPSCITPDFLAEWRSFLVGVQKHIKSMQPEDQGVKALASGYDMKYIELMEGVLGDDDMMSP